MIYFATVPLLADEPLPMNDKLGRELPQAVEEIKDAAPSAREALVDALLLRIQAKGTPIIVDETRAAFVYRGAGERIRVTGDMTNWSSELVLDRVGETNLFVKFAELPADARIEYMLVVDEQMMRDPLCKYHVLSGFGGASELAMPQYEHHPVFTGEVHRGKVGSYERVKELTLHSEALGYEKEVHVYQPPNVDPSQRLPTIYVHDGRDYIEFAHTPALLDYLIEKKRIRPVNAVFVSPPNRHQPDMPNRTTEYGLNPKYVTFMADELVPFIDERFATIAQADSRMTIGDSYAGLVSASIPHARPDRFGIGYSQSGYVSCEADKLIKAYNTKPAHPIRLYVDVGIYELTVGKGWLPDEEIDFLAANRRFRDVLRQQKYDYVYREYPEGHTWGNWRRHLADALIHFFPPQ